MAASNETDSNGTKEAVKMELTLSLNLENAA
jgi:hypothetical protein